MSAVILLLLIISPILNKRYSSKWRYFVWLVIALRLIIPIKAEIPFAPLNIPTVQNQTVVFRTERIPFSVMNEDYIERGNASPTSADYAPIITLGELLVIIWATGAIGFFLYHIINYISFKRKIKPYCKKADTKVFNTVLSDMKIRVKPRLLECRKIASPMMIGFFKPMVLIPNTDYSNEELTVILKHELTHYKRGDLWYKLLLIIANAMHWFNPFVYLMVKAANRDLEYSCDDVVVKNSDIHFRKEYSLAILKAMQRGETTALSTYLNGGSENE
jgi:beta-lactamase regulating signal transducer with metallopeptidase domain